MKHFMVSPTKFVEESQKLELPTTVASVYTAHKEGKNKYIVKDGDSVFVDVAALIRRREFHTKLWLRSHTLYYDIVAEMTQYRLAKILSVTYGSSQATWNSFMDNGLFSSAFRDKGILSYQVPMKLWQFYRLTTAVTRTIKRHERRISERDRFSAKDD